MGKGKEDDQNDGARKLKSVHGNKKKLVQDRREQSRADVVRVMGKDGQGMKEPIKPAKNDRKKGSASTDRVSGE
ncbi:hypothetical protein ACLB2K_070954 [Fragaria x ananassa]